VSEKSIVFFRTDTLFFLRVPVYGRVRALFFGLVKRVPEREREREPDLLDIPLQTLTSRDDDNFDRSQRSSVGRGTFENASKRYVDASE